MAFQVFSPAFPDGGWIPDLYTRPGADISPSLEWNGEPPETRSFAFILDDPDAPGGAWNHWLVYDLSPKVHTVAQGWKPGAGQSGRNSWDKPGYGGPCPPKGHGPHRYFFRLYALDVPSLEVEAQPGREALDRAMEGHILAEAHYMGRYERQ